MKFFLISVVIFVIFTASVYHLTDKNPIIIGNKQKSVPLFVQKSIKQVRKKACGCCGMPLEQTIQKLEQEYADKRMESLTTTVSSERW